MPGLLSGSTLRRGGSGEFIDLKGAQPQLPPSPTTSTGYTLITNDKLVTTYSSSLGNVEFKDATAYSNIPGQSLRLVGTDTTSVIISGGSVSTSTGTGALVVEGGVGVWGDIAVGGNASFQNLISAEFTATTATILTLKVIGTDSSTSFDTGALQISGGVGIAENLNVQGTTILAELSATTSTVDTLHVLDREKAISAITGAVRVAGGVGIEENLYVGTTLNVAQTGTFLSDVKIPGDVYITGQLNVEGQEGVNLNPVAASVSIQPTLGGTITIRPSQTGSIDDMVIGQNQSRNAYFADAYATNFIGLATTATNIAGGEVGGIPYQTAPGVTGFIGIGPLNSALVSNGTTATWTDLADITASTATNSDNIFINDVVTSTYQVILSTGTNSYAPLAASTGLSYDSADSSLTVVGSVYSQDGVAYENNLLYTPTATLSIGSPPIGPRLGDFWIDPSQGATFQYILDGTSTIWIQFTSI